MSFWFPIAEQVSKISAGEVLRVTVSKVPDMSRVPEIKVPTDFAVPNHSDLKIIVHSLVKNEADKSYVITFELANA